MRGVAALLVLVLVPVAAAPAEAAFLSTEQEIAIGREAAQELESEYHVVADPARTRSVSAIGQRLAAISDRRALPWTFKILTTNEVNAISLPGGFVYVTRGMMAFVRSEDELAFVLGHEVGHVDRRHHVAIIERNFLFSIVFALIFGGREGLGPQVGALNDRIARVREQLRTLGYRVSLFRRVVSPDVLAMSPGPS